MASGNDANDSKNISGCNGIFGFLKQTKLIRVLIATGVLFYAIQQIVGLESDDIALITILSGIAGSAATFLFSSASCGEG